MSKTEIKKETVLALPAQKTANFVRENGCYYCPLFSGQGISKEIEAEQALGLGRRF